MNWTNSFYMLVRELLSLAYDYYNILFLLYFFLKKN